MLANRNALSGIQKNTGQAWDGMRKFLPSKGRKPDGERHPGHWHFHTTSAAQRMHSICVLCRKTCSQDGRHCKLLLNIPQIHPGIQLRSRSDRSSQVETSRRTEGKRQTGLPEGCCPMDHASLTTRVHCPFHLSSFHCPLTLKRWSWHSWTLCRR